MRVLVAIAQELSATLCNRINTFAIDFLTSQITAFFEHLKRSQTAQGSAHLVSIASWVESQLGDKVRSYIIVASSDKPASLDTNGAVLLDPERELHQTYGAGAESLYLIRPDGYIGFRSQPVEKEPLLQYLSQLFRLKQAHSIV
jgi:hypothetical protein